MYQIEFPVGDWSGDGHNQYKKYIVQSNKPVNVVGEAHFNSPINIGNICSEYLENIPSDELLTQMRELGLSESIFPPEGHWWSSENIIECWIAILMIVDPTLELSVVNLPSIISYTVNNKGRCLNTPGYGVFDC